MGTSCGAPIMAGFKELVGYTCDGCQSRTVVEDTRTSNEDTHLGYIDRNSGPGEGTMSNVHATYPLWVWTRSELATRVTIPIGG